ncbi:MAG: hypothetical protein QOH87_4130 [Trebonia sp.]|nr:hypothetical protein [Trebonia sp.]
MAGAATESSSAWFLANATTASAAPGSAGGLAPGVTTEGTSPSAASAATRWPGLIWSLAVTSMRSLSPAAPR